MRHSDPKDQEFVDVEVNVHAVTAKAALLSNIDEDESCAVWIAKSQLNGAKLERDATATVGMRRWLARKEQFHHDD